MLTLSCGPGFGGLVDLYGICGVEHSSESTFTSCNLTESYLHGIYAILLSMISLISFPVALLLCVNLLYGQI